MQPPLSSDDLRFLAVLVQKGHLPKENAEKLLALAAQRPGTALDDLMIRAGFQKERVDFLRATGGEDVPSIPGYTYLERIGFGGTAVVFKGRENSSGREVALKVMHKELLGDPVQRRRFVREAKLLMQLEHANIVRGHRVGHVKDKDGLERLVFIMEWVPGESLLLLLRKGMQFPEDAALYIILQACRALQYLHGHGILHRDVKPDNVLLTRDNTVKLIDLGFATSIDEAKTESNDTTLGTAAYMSPEQARGISDLDVRSDIYSLGATLFQIAVGELPFHGEGTQEQLAARILEALSSSALQSRRISPHMNYFIRKMMEQDREFRYQGTAELIADIEEQIKGKKSLTYRPDVPDSADAMLDRPFDDKPKTPPKTPPPRRPV